MFLRRTLPVCCLTAAAIAAAVGVAHAAPPLPPCTITGAGVINGTPGDDVICGSGGADAIDGLGGDDVLIGGGGADTLIGGSGSNVIHGEGGDDILGAGTGDDGFVGGSGYDRVTYADRPVAATITAALADANSASGQDGSGQYYRDGNGDGALAENDRIYDDVEYLRGHEGADLLYGNDSANTLDGAGGDDTLIGLKGDDIVRGRGGADVLDGGFGADSLEPGAGDDFTFGGENSDTLIPGDETDGADYWSGGLGVDTIQYARTTPTRVTLNAGGADDGRYDPLNLSSNVEGDEVASVERAVTGSANDILIGTSAANQLVGNAGSDEIEGGAGVDSLQGGIGTDVIKANDGEADTVNCGADGDTLYRDAFDFSQLNCETLL